MDCSSCSLPVVASGHLCFTLSHRERKIWMELGRNDVHPWALALARPPIIINWTGSDFMTKFLSFNWINYISRAADTVGTGAGSHNVPNSLTNSRVSFAAKRKEFEGKNLINQVEFVFEKGCEWTRKNHRANSPAGGSRQYVFVVEL